MEVYSISATTKQHMTHASIPPVRTTGKTCITTADNRITMGDYDTSSHHRWDSYHYRCDIGVIRLMTGETGDIGLYFSSSVVVPRTLPLCRCYSHNTRHL